MSKINALTMQLSTLQKRYDALEKKKAEVEDALFRKREIYENAKTEPTNADQVRIMFGNIYITDVTMSRILSRLYKENLWKPAI